MDTFGGALGVIVTLFALVAILGVAYVYFRGSADKATIESQGRLLSALTDENANLARRVTHLETENADLRVAVAEVRGITELKTVAAAIKADTSAILLRVG